ncbi:MAG TPA: site-2 protease family protein [Opitutaceae bacterium]
MEHDLASGVMWYAVFLFSTVCHEAAHAWSAFRLGDETARKGGQVTLNPVPHIRREIMGMVVVPILSWFVGGWIIGWASTPYNLAWSRAHPRKAALMALAGPATNLALAVCAALLIRLGFEWGVFGIPYEAGMAHLASTAGGAGAELAAKLLSIALSLNLLLFAFNLIPLPPLDGSQAPLLLLPEAAAEKYAAALRSPVLRMVGILVAWKVIPLILPGLIRSAVRLLYA